VAQLLKHTLSHPYFIPILPQFGEMKIKTFSPAILTGLKPVPCGKFPEANAGLSLGK
jgi:hypothetical protein